MARSSYVLLDTLTYLQRGGRIGRAQSFLGGILNVKPLLCVRDGEVHPEARVRSRQQGIAKMVDIAAALRPWTAWRRSTAVLPELLTLIELSCAPIIPESNSPPDSLGAVVGNVQRPGRRGHRSAPRGLSVRTDRRRCGARFRPAAEARL